MITRIFRASLAVLLMATLPVLAVQWWKKFNDDLAQALAGLGELSSS